MKQLTNKGSNLLDNQTNTINLTKLRHQPNQIMQRQSETDLITFQLSTNPIICKI